LQSCKDIEGIAVTTIVKSDRRTAGPGPAETAYRSDGFERRRPGRMEQISPELVEMMRSPARSRFDGDALVKPKNLDIPIAIAVVGALFLFGALLVCLRVWAG
jgi:hypothetical protein